MAVGESCLLLRGVTNSADALMCSLTQHIFTEAPIVFKGFAERSVAAGNLALEGAFLYGQSQFAAGDEAAETLKVRAYERIHAMQKQTKVLNLAMQPEFERVYVESMNFPSAL